MCRHFGASCGRTCRCASESVQVPEGCAQAGWCGCVGEEPHTGIIAGITDGRPSVVTCVEDERLQFQVPRLLPGFASG